MNKIKELFDPAKNLYRSIEKVVTFGNIKPEALLREISEYVVTTRLRNNFEKILDAMAVGMQSESHEIGIWVSGFYGSGKSSFAKYFGLGFKKGLILDGIPFQERLINRIDSLPVSQQLKGIIQKYDPQVFLIDLASEQIGGHTLAPVGTIIYHEVMKWAGYAKEEKIALLERKLELDGRLDAFKKKVFDLHEEDWDKLKLQDQLASKGIAQELAPQFYPNIWKDAASFNLTRVDNIENDKEKITQMLALIRKKSGKENVLFIVDEVGQYVSADNSLILQLQGTMENFKDIGNGKAWLMATAQQTLTEDNPNARFNSDKLYKLNDRFPIKIEIEASDIKEITTRRLLGKSPDGANELKKLHARYGEMVRTNTRLSNVERTIYKSDLDESSFINLYPFLPHHFNILLALLARLAKKTGGIGLRSAIRVIQDVLTENMGDQLAEDEIGRLATTAHIFNVLKADIRKSYPHIAASVDKVIDIFRETSEEVVIAKSIGALQILDDFYLSVENLAVMIHPSIDAPSQLENTRKIIDDLKKTKGLTLKEIDGQLRFMTDSIIRVEEEKQRIFVSGIRARKVFESQVEEIFTPIPTARIENTKTVRSGIQLVLNDRTSKITTESDEIQTEVHFVSRAKFSETLDALKHRSTEKLNESRIFCLGILDEDLDKAPEEIVRCEEIAEQKTKYEDKEILDYLNSQQQEAQILRSQLTRKLQMALEAGEFIFRGASRPCKVIADNIRDAAGIWLKSSAEKVYDKYRMASQTVENSASQRILHIDDLRQIPVALNPFNLVKTDGSIDISSAPLSAIKDYLQNEGQVDGRKLLEDFNEAPYGWHKDTTRYLVTLLFLASVVKLRIGGESVKVKGQSAIERLSGSSGFNQIGISLHDEDQPTKEQVLRAAKVLAELTLSTVPPLPQKISEVTMKHFPEFQRKYAELRPRLEALKLPGIEKAELIQEGITEIMKGDASDATFRLGKEDSDLYHALLWAKKVFNAFTNGIENVIRRIHDAQKEISVLPNEGLIGELKATLERRFSDVGHILQSENFFENAANLNDAATEIESIVTDTCERLAAQQNAAIKETIEQLKSGYNWQRLEIEQQEEFSLLLERNLITGKPGVNGIREIINQVYSADKIIKAVEKDITDIIEKKELIPAGKKIRKVTFTHLPKRIEKTEDIDRIIFELNKIKDLLSGDDIIDIHW